MTDQNRSGRFSLRPRRPARPWPVLEAVALVLALLVGWRVLALHPLHLPSGGRVVTAMACRTHCRAPLDAGLRHRALRPSGETGFPARDDSLYTIDARTL